jgi:hypothetical protein
MGLTYESDSYSLADERSDASGGHHYPNGVSVRLCLLLPIRGTEDQMAETVKRLQPKGEVLRELYLRSGNVCAFPDCERLMLNREGVFVGQLCHIEAAEEGGERFNKLMTNEDRRAFKNLILMCYDHHTVTNDVEEPCRHRMKPVPRTLPTVGKPHTRTTKRLMILLFEESRRTNTHRPWPPRISRNL